MESKWKSGTWVARRQFLGTAIGAAALPGPAAQQARGTRSRVVSQPAPDLVFETAQLRLTVAGDGMARSLIHKASGQECLAQNVRTPAFVVRQFSPLPGQFTISYPADLKILPPSSIRRDGDRLHIRFDELYHEAIVRVRITDEYIAFVLENLEHVGDGWTADDRRKVGVDEVVLLQLPVRDRRNFGSWLNVTWDDQVAVALIAADPRCRIDGEERDGYRLFRAACENRVGFTGVGAALIAAPAGGVLDCVARVERDFALPNGVEKRRSPEARYSYYWPNDVTPQNIERHIKYARQAGLRAILLSHRTFASSAGHFPWRPEYPGGMDDLRGVTDKLRAAGITPGLHIHYNKAQKTDPYVSPRPDHRLNLQRLFTLAADLSSGDGTIYVEQNPEGSTLDPPRCFLKIGEELVTYESYSTEIPYRFLGCKRGQLDSKPSSYKAGFLFGLLDVDRWPIFVVFNQDTSIQKEVAGRIATIYKDAGFQFVYFDGAEDVHAPWWFNTSRAQHAVFRELSPEPAFAEGAHRSHFSWHMLSRGCAFDINPGEVVKEGVRKLQAAVIARMEKDFTKINFGWLGMDLPSPSTIGMQPDLMEYAVSRAAGWDCPFSLSTNLELLDRHPRVADILEVMRRWEQVRVEGKLTPAERQALRNLDQEHTLFLAAEGRLELHACEHITQAAGGDRRLRAFVFERRGEPWILYWHISGEAELMLPAAASKVRVQDDRTAAQAPESFRTGAVVRVSHRRYLHLPGFSRAQAVDLLRKAQIR